MISIHGLVRGHHPELGRDADTGGQIAYVVELARALAKHDGVGQVDLLTRQLFDKKIHTEYSHSSEILSPGARIIRLPCGPRRYLRKEALWPHLDSFTDQALQHIRRVGRVPDIIHAHYADAGYVGAQLSGLLGVPFIFTGHSLGREKLRRLLDRGATAASVDSRYNINQRIEAEELALDSAALVVVSTHQEINEQYRLYHNYQPRRMSVIPPGIDLSRFRPATQPAAPPPIKKALARFLKDPAKPLILALSRADERKNISTLVRAYGENPRLRSIANLAIIAGNRDVIARMDKGPRKVLIGLLALIDSYDLYGSVAYPKHHDSDDVPDLYRLAALTRGVFVNPALTEPFGLTLIEAAASGLPLVATNDGGPVDIITQCKNGLLVDPLDVHAMSDALLSAITDQRRWKRWARNGVLGAHRHYSWEGHAETYVKCVRKLLGRKTTRKTIATSRSRLPTVDRMVVCDVDGTLLGDRLGLTEFLRCISTEDHHIGFGVASGRHIDSTVKILRAWNIPMPDVFITSVGSEIHYGPRLVRDNSWHNHIDYRWQPEELLAFLNGMPGLKLQSVTEQRSHKISYLVDPDKAPPMREIQRQLRERDLHAKVIYSHGCFLDLLPIRASKGLAVRYLSMRWGLNPERFLVAGDSGNDVEMLSGDTLGVVVSNHSPEVARLKNRARIYFAAGEYANGIVEGIDYYDFLGEINVHNE